MADDEIRPDDPFLERRLATLSALPVPERPTVDQLAARGVEVELDDPAGLVADRSSRRAHRVWLLSAAAAVVVVVLVALTLIARGDRSGVADGDGSAGLAPQLAGQEFWSVAVTESGVEKDLTNNLGEIDVVRLHFLADGSIRASAGCNQLNGEYRIEDRRLKMGPIGSTHSACYGAIADRDEWLRGILDSSPTIAVEGRTLTLASGTTIIELLDREVADADLSLVGPWWELHTIVEGGESRSAFGGPMTDPPSFTILSLPDGQLVLNGSDGCQVLRVSLAVDGATLRSSEPTAAERDCVSGREAAVAFDAILGGESSYVIDGSRLTITHAGVNLVFQGTERSSPTLPQTTAPSIVERTPLTGIDAAAALTGPRWDLDAVVVDGTRTEVDGSSAAPAAWLQFRTDTERFTAVMDGGDRCGEFASDVVVLGSTITFAPVQATTPTSCRANLTPVDVALQGVLAGEASYSTDGTNLTIANERASLELRRT